MSRDNRDPRNFRSKVGIYAKLGVLGALALFEGLKFADRAVNYDPSLQTGQQIEQVVSKEDLHGNKQDYALLINAQGRLEGRKLDTTGAINQAYRTLKNRGYSDKNIVILTPSMLEGRNVNTGITAKPSEKNMELAEKYLAKNLTPDSTLTVFYEGHHGRVKEGGKMYLGNSTISDQKFSDYFKDLPGKKIFLLDSCYSGYLGKKINETPGDKLVLCATDVEHMGISGFGKDTWERIDAGESVKEAYRNSMDSHNSKTRTKFNEWATKGKAKNIYTEYSTGNIDLPYPAHKFESHAENKVPFWKGLEGKVMNSLLVISSLAFITSLSSAITGNVIGFNAPEYIGNRYLLFSSALLCILILTRKILKKK